MIERFYLDNYRSFVGFEWKPEKLTLLLGPNGSGKTVLLEALGAVQQFLNAETSAGEAFPRSSRTRWDLRGEQTFELDVRIAGRLYTYRLVVLHDAEGRSGPLVATESLRCDDGSNVAFGGGELTRSRDGVTERIAGTKPTRSAIGALRAEEGGALGKFQAWAASKLWLLRPDPRAMSGRVDRRRVGAPPWLLPDLSNFAAWYLATLTSKPGSIFKAHHAITEALPGFVELFEDVGELAARFERGATPSIYRFDELSDGEKVLIALNVLLHAVAGPGKTLVLDEPDNYLGLREVQPWLASLADQTLRTDGPQVVLVSHHPDALNFLAVESGWRMFRDPSGLSRLERFRAAAGADPAGTVARGWDETE